MTENNLAITPIAAQKKMELAMTRVSLSIQALQDEADSLVINEDEENLGKADEFEKKCKKAAKAVEDEFEIGKKPIREAGQAWDAGKRDLLKLINDVKNPVSTKISNVKSAIYEKEQADKRKKEQEQAILDGIEANILDFSSKIASCLTKQQLNDVERLINLEKSPSRASKYGEFHKQAIDRFNETLLPILKDQKTKIDEREALEKELNSTDDPNKHDELKAKLEEKENEIRQNQVSVQEIALMQQATSESVEQINPSVAVKRFYIEPEIENLELVFKKQRELLNIELKTAEAVKQGKVLHDAGAFGDKDELSVNGIKYKIRRTWK